MLGEDLLQDGCPELRVVLRERRVVGGVHDFGAVRGGLARRALELRADQERHCSPAELPRELSAAGDQLEGNPAEPSVDELADAPAVEARAGLVRDVPGLLPARRLRGAL